MRVQLQVKASGEPALWVWWAEFRVLADGRQTRLSVGSPTHPFHVVSTGEEQQSQRHLSLGLVPHLCRLGFW